MNEPETIFKIQRMHAKARAYMTEDPEVALMLARKTAEAVCKLIFVDKVSENTGSLMLDKLIEQLTIGKHVPKHVLTHLRTIQVHGNFGAHDQEEDNDAIDVEYVRPCIQSLDYICRWVMQTYLPPLSFTPPCVVRDVAVALGIKPFQIIADLMSMNTFVHLNDHIDPKTTEAIVTKHGRKVVFTKSCNA